MEAQSAQLVLPGRKRVPREAGSSLTPVGVDITAMLRFQLESLLILRDWISVCADRPRLVGIEQGRYLPMFRFLPLPPPVSAIPPSNNPATPHRCNIRHPRPPGRDTDNRTRRG